MTREPRMSTEDTPTDAADPEGERHDEREDAAAGEPLSPGTDLDPEEGADVMETREEAERVKTAREDVRDEDIISLEGSD